MRQLRPHTFIAEIQPGRLQVGSAPPHMVIFSDLSPAEVKWLMLLQDFDSLTKTERGELDRNVELTQRQEEILVMLNAAGLLTGDTSNLADLHVRIVGLDRVGVRLASLLAEEGVGAIDLKDRRAVSPELGRFFDSADLGRPRQTALAQELRGRYRDTKFGTVSNPDLVVVCSANTWDHGVLGRLLSQDVPHLPVVERDRSIQIGPIVVPGRTGCVVCADLTMTDSFPLWAQSSLALGAAPEPQAPDYLCATAAGLAVALIVAAYTGDVPSGGSSPAGVGGVAHSFEVGLTGVSTREWYPHPKCACQQDGLALSPDRAA